MSNPGVDELICIWVKLSIAKGLSWGWGSVVCQKYFNYMFLKYVKLATGQVIGKLRRFVEEWAPEKFEVQECVER